MSRRPGQSFWNYIGNSIPIVKTFVPGENYQDYNNRGSPTSNNFTANLNNSSLFNKSSNMQGLSNYIGPLISLAGSVGGALINANSTRKTNEAQIAHAMDLYNMSREDAILFWQMQNEYNSPVEQMSRLRDAGLNPHLVYGNGATTTAGSISAPQAKMANLHAPQYGDALSSAMQGLSSYYTLEQQKANISKTRAETQSVEQRVIQQQFENSLLDRDWAQALRTAKAYSLADQRQTVIGKTLSNQLEQELQGIYGVDPIADLATSIVSGGSVPVISSDRGDNVKIRQVELFLQKVSKEMDAIDVMNDLRLQQRYMNELEIKFNRELGLPPNSPYWMQMILRFLKVKYDFNLIGN